MLGNTRSTGKIMIMSKTAHTLAVLLASHESSKPSVIGNRSICQMLSGRNGDAESSNNTMSRRKVWSGIVNAKIVHSIRQEYLWPPKILARLSAHRVATFRVTRLTLFIVDSAAVATTPTTKEPTIPILDFSEASVERPTTELMWSTILTVPGMNRRQTCRRITI